MIEGGPLKDRIHYVFVTALLAALGVLPHRWRVPLAGWFATWILAPILGWRRRIGGNLDHAMPDLPVAKRRELLRTVPDNLGRLFMELFSPKDMQSIVANTPFTGAGAEALKAAMADGKAVICVSGHFGNYDVFRSAAIQHGGDVAGLYRPLNNKLIHARYIAAISAVGGKLFSRGRQGFAGMIRHLQGGGLMALLIDQHMNRGERLTFFDQPAFTAISAGQMALKYEALLFPVYGIRQPDGLSYVIEVEAQVPASDAVTMTQALNDSLEAQVRAHPEQWLWTHRRWKDRTKATGSPKAKTK
ncbi:MAG: lauroyl acyltransferase [Octadecabacter sp.]